MQESFFNWHFVYREHFINDDFINDDDVKV